MLHHPFTRNTFHKLRLQKCIFNYKEKINISPKTLMFLFGGSKMVGLSLLPRYYTENTVVK
jgi:hypothetical protein